MGRREPKVRDTRERVLAAALAEFASRGLAAASIEDIAARAGVTKGAVYYYFADKDDLAGDLQADLWQRLGGQAALSFDPEAGALENLKAAFGAFLGALGDEAEARFFLRDCWHSPSLDQAGRRTHEGGVAMVRDLLETGLAAGEVTPGIDADAAARVLLGAFAEATLHILTTGRADQTMAVVALMVDALGAPPSSSGARRTGARVGAARRPAGARR